MNRINYGLWLWRIISWDTLVPASLLVAPFAIHWAFPNWPGFIEIAAVSLPVLAFFLRLQAGKQQIAANQCSLIVRRIHFGVLCIGILPLILFDCFILLGALANAMWDKETMTGFAVIIAIYLSAMVIAMYPGRIEPLGGPESI